MKQITPELIGQWKDRLWRLHNLYYIIDEYGKKVKFTPREGQLKFLKEAHTSNIILKARQLGISTIIQLLMLDSCVFNSNVNAGIITHTLPEAKELLRTKIKFPYDNLPQGIRNAVALTTDNKEALAFANGSQIRVGTSMRGGTLQWLHISEFGTIALKDPLQTQEIITGALNTLQPSCGVFIESTARGKGGAFYDMCINAYNKQKSQEILSPLDFKFYFHAWWEDPKYVLNPKYVDMTLEDEEYFQKLQLEHDINLSDAQKAWYVKKKESQGENMKQEFPSYPEEAFEQSTEGVIFATELTKAREEKRIETFPILEDVPVSTYWDIGISDYTAIWLIQKVGYFYNFIHYYENSGEYPPFYAKYLQGLPFIWDKHYFPHDSKNRDTRCPGSLLGDYEKLLPGEIYYVPRISSKQVALNQAKKIFPTCKFHKTKAAEGIRHLDNYRKEWNTHLQQWRHEPRHDKHSHCADAFLVFAQSRYLDPTTNHTTYRDTALPEDIYDEDNYDDNENEWAEMSKSEIGGY